MRTSLVMAVALVVAGCGGQTQTPPRDNPPAKGDPTPPPSKDGTPAPTAAFKEHPHLAGGESPDAAAAVALDASMTGRFCAKLAADGRPQYFKIEGKAGWAIRIRASSKSDAMNHELLGSESQTLERKTGELVSEMTWLPGAQQSSYVYLIRVWRPAESAVVANIEVAFLDNTDAGGGTDAGNGFQVAAEAKGNSFKGWLSGGDSYRGKDAFDMIKFTAAKGQEVSVTVTPAAKMRVSLRLYDDAQQEKARQDGEGEGMPVTIKARFGADGPAYLGVQSQGKGGGQYSVEISR